MRLMNAAERPDSDHHHPDRHHDGHDHDRKIFGHADRGDDAVDREHDVDHDDLDEAGEEAERAGRLPFSPRASRLDAVVDLARRLPDQEQAARQQQEVADRKSAPEHGGERLRETHHPRRGSEQRQTEQQREHEAEFAREAPPAFVDAVREQRDEDEIVEAEHDLHGDQGRERRPCVGVFRQAEKIVHAPLSPSP